MALSKAIVTQSIELFDDGRVNVKERVQVFEDGIPLGAPSTHRRALAPGEALDNLPQDCRATIETHWTEDRRARWADAEKARSAMTD
jgi:hypothetical protein